ncbi:MAG TPA: restriction endonuclease subunit S, partial [Opitutae bacterium]|nr:restriction endonuclease subunit S [Opitutae bacterium]
MSNSIFIDRLLNGEKVTWSPLGDAVDLEKGKQLNKELLSKEGLFPAYNGGISYS